jgi:UTP--glucose-1-phosphate uridylyltransferase
MSSPPRVRKAVIPAAGLGTRFLPATKAQPKEMLPLVDTPTIQYVVEEAVASGLARLIIVTGRNKRAIEDHFDTAFELERYLSDRGKTDELAQVQAISALAEMCYVRQKQPLGLGHAVLAARAVVDDEPFGVLLGDDIIAGARVPCMRQLLDVYDRYGHPVIAVERVERARLDQYGVIAGRNIGGNVWEISDLVEKPRVEDAPSDLAIIGRYVLTPDLFDVLAGTPADARGEIQLTDGLRALRGRRPMYAVQFEGTRYDTGDRLGFLKTTVAFALARPDLGAEFRAYLKSLRL